MTLKQIQIPSLPSFIGYNHLFDAMNTVYKNTDDGYPKYNIITIDEDSYSIELALAGFTMEDIDIEVQEQILTITGNPGSKLEDSKYIHKGISNRKFSRKFNLAEYIEVLGARFENGVLTINLAREIPDEKKARKILIEPNKPELLLED